MTEPIEPVEIVITAVSDVPTQEGFGTILALCYHDRFPELFRMFSALSELDDLGFHSYDPAYRMATAIKSQEPAPRQFMIGRLPTAFTWKAGLTVKSATAGSVVSFNVDFDGVLYPVSRTVPGSSSLAAEAAAIAALVTGLTGGDPTNAVAISDPGPWDLTGGHGDLSVTLDTGAATAHFTGTEATVTGVGAVYGGGALGGTPHLQVTITGLPSIDITFAGTENSLLNYLTTIAGQITANGGARDDGTGQLQFYTTREGNGAHITITGGDAPLIAALGLGSPVVVAGTGNVSDLAHVSGAEFSAVAGPVITGIAGTSLVDGGGRATIKSSTTGSGAAVTISGTAQARFNFPGVIQHGAAGMAFVTGAAPGGAVVNIDALAPGQPFWIRDIIGADFVNRNGTNGFDTALSTIAAHTNDFYGVAIESQSAQDIEAVAAWTEPRGKLFGCVTQDTREKQTGNGVLGPFLRTHTYLRTSPWYHPRGEYLECGVMGCTLVYSLDTGIIPTWAYRNVKGISAYTVTTDEATYLQAQNVNVYVPIHRVNRTWEGKVASGQYADFVVSRDWFSARSQEAVFGYIATQLRVGYTDDGIQKVGDAWYPVLKLATDNGMFAVMPVMTLPKADDVSTGERTGRVLGGGGLKASGRFGGAIHKVQVNFTITF